MLTRILDVRILARGDVVELNGKRWTFQRVNWADNCRWVELELMGEPVRTYQPSIHWVEENGLLLQSYPDPFAEPEAPRQRAVDDPEFPDADLELWRLGDPFAE